MRANGQVKGVTGGKRPDARWLDPAQVAATLSAEPHVWRGCSRCLATLRLAQTGLLECPQHGLEYCV